MKYQNQSKKFRKTILIQILKIDPDLSSNSLQSLVKNLKIRSQTAYHFTVIRKRRDLQQDICQTARLSRKILNKLFPQLEGRFQEIIK